MRPQVGLGHVIIPSDIDREKYLIGVYSTGVLMIRTEYQDTIHSCRVSREVIERLLFPAEPGQLGTAVVWVNVANLDFTVIVGTLPNGTDRVTEGEHSKTETIEFEDTIINRTLDAKKGIYTISVTTDELGIGYKIKVSSDKTSSFELTPEGVVEIYGEEAIHLSSYKALSVSIVQGKESVDMTLDFDGIQYTDRFKNEIYVNEEGVQFVTKKFGIDEKLQVGDGSSLSPLVKYDQLEDVLGILMVELLAMAAAINSVVSGSVNIPKLLEAQVKFTTFKSTKTSSE